MFIRVIACCQFNLVDLHALVAEPGDVGHGTVKQESQMDAVGRDQARRGQPVDKPVTRSVRYQDREKDHEMLARGSELDGHNDKLSVEYQGIESELPKLEFNQELKDCVGEPRRRFENRFENRFERGSEFKCVLKSHLKGRFDYGLECENAASEFWEIS